MSTDPDTTAFWSPDCPIAQAAKAQQAQLDWINMSRRRIANDAPLFVEVA